MKKYEAMFIVKPTLSEEERKALFSQIDDTVVKNNGGVLKSGLWSERRKLFFPIKKHQEGVYYLMNFTLDPAAIAKIRHAYKLNENILMDLIISVK